MAKAKRAFLFQFQIDGSVSSNPAVLDKVQRIQKISIWKNILENKIQNCWAHFSTFFREVLIVLSKLETSFSAFKFFKKSFNSPFFIERIWQCHVFSSLKLSILSIVICQKMNLKNVSHKKWAEGKKRSHLLTINLWKISIMDWLAWSFGIPRQRASQRYIWIFDGWIY